jgi:hypothetical protein
MPVQDHTPQPRGDRTLLVVGIAWFVAYVVARAVLEQPDLPRGLRLAAALLPVPLFAAFLVRFVRSLRGADELERRIHLEALAIAFPLTILLLQTLWLLERAVGLKFEDWSYGHVWAYLPLFYFLGLVVSRRRYA